ncbi:hypothetical protein KC324_g19268, partial [Hortaea werneckii]
ALLTFLITGDWRDVMKTHYLHLGYRVALGLKYLNDTELSGFMQTETARAIRNGDLEGILLTGLGERSLELFQTYLTRSADLQTVVLATAFTNPRYVDDSPTKIQGALAANSGAVCLRCGRHMPRCALCNLWLGTPLTSPSLASSTARPSMMKRSSSGTSMPIISARSEEEIDDDEDEDDDDFADVAGKSAGVLDEKSSPPFPMRGCGFGEGGGGVGIRWMGLEEEVVVMVVMVVVEKVEKGKEEEEEEEEEEERGKSCVPFPGVDVVVDFLGIE